MNDHKPCIPSMRSLEKWNWREWPQLSFFIPLRNIFIKQQISRKRVFSLIKEKHTPCLSEEIDCMNAMHLPKVNIYIW